MEAGTVLAVDLSAVRVELCVVHFISVFGKFQCDKVATGAAGVHDVVGVLGNDAEANLVEQCDEDMVRLAMNVMQTKGVGDRAGPGCGLKGEKLFLDKLMAGVGNADGGELEEIAAHDDLQAAEREQRGLLLVGVSGLCGVFGWLVVFLVSVVLQSGVGAHELNLVKQDRVDHGNLIDDEHVEVVEAPAQLEIFGGALLEAAVRVEPQAEAEQGVDGAAADVDGGAAGAGGDGDATAVGAQGGDDAAQHKGLADAGAAGEEEALAALGGVQGGDLVAVQRDGAFGGGFVAGALRRLRLRLRRQGEELRRARL